MQLWLLQSLIFISPLSRYLNFVYFMTLFILFRIYMLRKRHVHDIISISEVICKMENMGDRIKRLRSENNMTLEELGNRVGVGKSTVRKWENGIIANMRRDKIAKLAVALGVTPAYLMGWESTADIPMERVPNKVESVQSSSVSAQCKEIIEVCNQLSPHNQRKVLTYSKNLLSTQQMEEDLLAAHARTDIEVTPEGQKHDIDIMNDESRW